MGEADVPRIEIGRVRPRLRWLLLLGVAAALFLLPAQAHAQYPCIGAPADNPSTTYPEPRVFIEAQGWWATGADPGEYGEAEHLHVATCFPFMQTVSGSFRLDVRVIGHNLPTGTLLHRTRVHDGSTGATIISKDWNRTVLLGEMDVKRWSSLAFDSRKVPDGRREIRFLTDAQRPDGTEIHATSGWCLNVQNGTADSNSSECPLAAPFRTTGRGWYNGFEYKNARYRSDPRIARAAGQDYAFTAAFVDGAAGDTAVTSWEARLDPDFHMGQNGVVLASGRSGTSQRGITIPAANMTPGMHFVTLLTHDRGSIGGRIGEVTGVVKVPLKVR